MIPIPSFFRLFYLYPHIAARALERATYAGEPPATLETLKAIYHAVDAINQWSYFDMALNGGDRPVKRLPADGFMSVYERDPFMPILRSLLTQRHPEPFYRVQQIVCLLNLLVERGAKVIPARTQLALWDVSEHDPDKRVRAWALFAMNPHGKDVPDDLGEGT